jgi:hypothetical protein
MNALQFAQRLRTTMAMKEVGKDKKKSTITRAQGTQAKKFLKNSTSIAWRKGRTEIRHGRERRDVSTYLLAHFFPFPRVLEQEPPPA